MMQNLFLDIFELCRGMVRIHQHSSQKDVLDKLQLGRFYMTLAIWWIELTESDHSLQNNINGKCVRIVWMDKEKFIHMNNISSKTTQNTLSM